MLLLDPEVESDPEVGTLLTQMGLSVDFTPLAHERKYVRLTGGPGDQSILFTNRFMAHESTQALARLSTQVALVFPTTGSLNKLEGLPSPKEGGVMVRATVRSLPDTFADLNGDLKFGPEEEKKAYDLVAAVKLPALDDGQKGGRGIVAADVDLVTDQILRKNSGNQQWLVDAIHYLEDDIQLIGSITEPEDSPILHSRDEDQALFYATVAGMPLFILLLGVGLRRKNRSIEVQG